jgi:hypothetical protein
VRAAEIKDEPRTVKHMVAQIIVQNLALKDVLSIATSKNKAAN